MRPLRTGERRRCNSRGSWESRLYLDFQALAMQVQTGPPSLSPTPIPPEERSGSYGEGMQHLTDLTRLLGCTALPLTPFP